MIKWTREDVIKKFLFAFREKHSGANRPGFGISENPPVRAKTGKKAG
jgi:hypothetical protein